MKEKKTKKFNLHMHIVSALRKACRNTPMVKAAKDAAKEEFFLPGKTVEKIRRVHFKCAKCGRYFFDRKTEGSKSNDIAVDHTNPVISPEQGFVGWTEYIKRMFEGEMQVLCNYSGERDGMTSCHYQKTQRERTVARILASPVQIYSTPGIVAVSKVDWEKIKTAKKRMKIVEFQALQVIYSSEPVNNLPSKYDLSELITISTGDNLYLLSELRAFQAVESVVKGS